MASWRCSCTSAVAALALAAAATPTTQAQDPRINEVRVGQLGADNDEYFELAGTPSTPLTGVYYIVIGDDASNNQGVVEFVLNLLGQSIGASGFFLVVENTFSLSGTPNLVLPALDFEGGYRTHMIVTNFTEQVGADLDTDDDGVLDVFPWTSIIDCVALVGPGTPGVDGDYVYCATQVGPDGEFVPGHIYRCDPDLTWTVGEFDVAGPGATDTPSTVNTSCDFVPPCGSGLAGSCYEANGTPNCDDADCCNEIINNWDPSCADAWDQLCANLAQINCRTCGDPDAGDCFEPNGTAYCDIAECCTTVCKLDPSCCQLDGWDQACADLALANCPLAAVESGDVVIGLSNDNVDPADTLALARGDAVLNGGVLIDDSWAQPFMQSMEFDNLDGLTHNPQGNLLAVNFGTTADGGSIYSLATCEVVGPGQLIGNTTGLGGTGITLSQLGGLSVSPDNTKIAVTAYTTGKVIVYDYVAGDCMGAGAVLTNARETAQAPMCITDDTQGTTWLDDGVVLAFSSLGTVWAVDATTMGTTALASLTTTCGPAFTDIEYNPAISPYVFAMESEFSGGTLNTLWVLDPDSAWGIVNQVDYSTSIETTREIGFDGAGNLFVSQFSGNIDLIQNAAGNAAGLADNGSLDWFDTATEVDFASFPGMDVAIGDGGPEPCPGDCQPAPNGDVGVNDFLALIAQWGGPGSCDLDGNNVVNVNDFLDLIAQWGPCP
jgi:hypothetical protein